MTFFSITCYVLFIQLLDSYPLNIIYIHHFSPHFITYICSTYDKKVTTDYYHHTLVVVASQVFMSFTVVNAMGFYNKSLKKLSGLLYV